MKGRRRNPKDFWIADGNGFRKSWDVSNSQGTICEVITNRRDADLIAAAPELLEACIKAIDYMDENDLGGEQHELWQLLISAVSKAVGEK